MSKVKYSREKHLETVLRQLLSQHFYDIDLKWPYREGSSIRSVDKELYMQIFELIPEVINSKGD